MSKELIESKILAATETVKGYAVKSIQFMKIVGCYSGQIQDQIFQTKRGWSTCVWDKRGKAKNPNRQDCNLKLA